MEEDRVIPVHLLVISPCGTMLLAAQGECLLVASLKIGKESVCLLHSAHAGGVRAVAWTAASLSGEESHKSVLHTFASTGDDKRVVFWRDVDGGCDVEGGTYTPVTEWTSKKRVCGMAIAQLCSPGNEELVYATKFGEVFSVRLNTTPYIGESDDVVESNDNETKLQKLRLAHVSTITSLVLSPDETFILTSDRDEKIRTSHWPHAYDIQEFCLGHTQFLSNIVVIGRSEERMVLSGSGDGSLRLWNYVNGKQLDIVWCGIDHPHKRDDAHTLDPTSPPTTLSTVVPLCWTNVHQLAAVLVEGEQQIRLFTLKEKEMCVGEYDEGLVGASLEAAGVLPLPSPPLAATFDPKGNLWTSVTQPKDGIFIYCIDPITGSVSGGENNEVLYGSVAKTTCEGKICALVNEKVKCSGEKNMKEDFLKSLEWRSMRKWSKIPQDEREEIKKRKKGRKGRKGGR